MLIGRYYHNLETARRISLPAKFRKESKDWVVTRGFDGCLFVFKKDDFIKQIKQLSARTFTRKDYRDLIRLMTNEASEVKNDSLGRMQLPEYLTQFANLTKEIVVVGSFDYVEIWDREKYHQYMKKNEQEAEKIAERTTSDNS